MNSAPCSAASAAVLAMNSCPVYRHITGHGYGSIYPGPMGVVLTPLLVGYEKTAKLPYACSLCGQCAEVCPVKVPLPNLISQHRRNVVNQGYVSPVEKAIFTAAAATFSNRVTYGALTAAAAPGNEDHDWQNKPGLIAAAPGFLFSTAGWHRAISTR